MDSQSTAGSRVVLSVIAETTWVSALAYLANPKLLTNHRAADIQLARHGLLSNRRLYYQVKLHSKRTRSRLLILDPNALRGGERSSVWIENCRHYCLFYNLAVVLPQEVYCSPPQEKIHTCSWEMAICVVFLLWKIQDLCCGSALEKSGSVL